MQQHDSDVCGITPGTDCQTCRAEDAIYQDLDELRKAILEDLATAGETLLAVKQEDTVAQIALLMPKWRVATFRRCLAHAAANVLRAMDCLTWKESPTTEVVLDALIDRWQRAVEKEKVMILEKLRATIGKKHATQSQPSNGKAAGGDPKGQAAKP